MNKAVKDRKRLVAVLFFMILAFQTLVMVQLGRDKKEYHIDEIYTYILSNSYDTDRLANAKDNIGVWESGEVFNEFLTVQPGERFAYDKVYRNNSLDAHPPLFYFLVHTAASFFPNVFSKWFVLAINILAFMVCQFFLFLISRNIFGDSLWALLPAAIYGGTQLAFDTVNFMRMYMLMTMFTVILLYIHMRMILTRVRAADCLWCALVTFLGVFTQYYFAIFAFFMTVFTFFLLVWRKKMGYGFFYGFLMLCGVGLVFLVYPAGIRQITGSPTNNIGNEVARSIFDFSKFSARFDEFVQQLREQGANGLIHLRWLIVYAVIVCAVLAIVCGGKKAKTFNSRRTLWLVFGMCAVSVVLSVAVISHTSGSFSYVRYVYQLVPVMGLAVTLLAYILLSYTPLRNEFIALCFIAVFCLSSHYLLGARSATYLFDDYSDNLKPKIFAAVKDDPLIVVNNSSNYFLTANLTVFTGCRDVYILVLKDDTDIDRILSQRPSDKYAFMVLTDQNWSKGFDGDKVMSGFVEKSQILDSYEKHSICRFGTVYTASAGD